MHHNRTLLFATAVAAVCTTQALAGGHNLPIKILRGPVGPPAAGTSYTAVVKADGVLKRGSGVVSASQPEGVGTYEVDFAVDVTGCAYVATVGEPASSGTVPASDITVVGRSGVPEGVFVETANSKGVLKNRAFHIDVGC
jgi:hypothetical protein